MACVALGMYFLSQKIPVRPGAIVPGLCRGVDLRSGLTSIPVLEFSPSVDPHDFRSKMRVQSGVIPVRLWCIPSQLEQGKRFAATCCAIVVTHDAVLRDQLTEDCYGFTMAVKGLTDVDRSAFRERIALHSIDVHIGGAEILYSVPGIVGMQLSLDGTGQFIACGIG